MNNDYVYFFYSEEQIKEKNEIMTNSFREFIPGYVVVGNKREKITQITNNKSAMSRYIDAVIVAEGERNNFVFREPETISRTKKGAR